MQRGWRLFVDDPLDLVAGFAEVAGLTFRVVLWNGDPFLRDGIELGTYESGVQQLMRLRIHNPVRASVSVH